MFNEPPKRKPRIPLSPEEMYYVRQIKKFNELQKIQTFKGSNFYKKINTANIILAAFLSYCLLSILIVTKWQETKILKVENIYSEYNHEIKKRTISEITIYTHSGEIIPVKTTNLFEDPTPNDVIYIGRDFIFNKVLKVKLSYSEYSFWHLNAYALFTVCLIALILGFFVYKLNKHLSVNGLLTVLGLFSLASLYFIFI